MGFLGDRFLGDLKWKGKKGKKDEVVTAEVVDKSVREPALDSADMVVGETAPVKKRQYVFKWRISKHVLAVHFHSVSD